MKQPAAVPADLDALIEHRATDLAGYQNADYAARYRGLVERVRAAEKPVVDSNELTRAVAVSYHKLLAYKDEYEVARLYSDGRFSTALAAQFSGSYTVKVHLAPPFLARRDAATGRPRKSAYGPWVLRLFGLLARLRKLRGTHLDPFGYQRERRRERELIEEFERVVDELIAGLSADKHAAAIELASLPQQVRGFGHIKETALREVAVKQAALLASYREAHLETAA